MDERLLRDGTKVDEEVRAARKLIECGTRWVYGGRRDPHPLGGSGRKRSPHPRQGYSRISGRRIG